MGIVNALVRDTPLPKMVKVRQHFERPVITDISGEIRRELSRPEIHRTIRPGMRIAITGSSRGIANAKEIIRAISLFVQECGAHPFVVPAMGSHGGATAEGQREILAGYGITEDFIRCPVLATMETKLIGHTEEGHPVYIDRYAAEADGIIVNCRVKPHTGFRGPYKSGIMKMMTIGLGKQKGAEICHGANIKHFAKYIPMFGNAIRRNANVIAAVAAIENAYCETCRIAALINEEIPVREPELLEYAKKMMGRILVDKCDVLIVDAIGKNYSGDGMDPNVTGTWATPYASGGLEKQQVVILDLSDASHGNPVGMGAASFVTRRLQRKVDYEAAYANAITSKVLESIYTPIVAETDEDAIRGAVKVCQEIDPAQAEIVRIANTLELDTIYLSEPLYERVKGDPGLEKLSEPEPFSFDKTGALISG